MSTAGGDQKKAAKSLGLSVNALYAQRIAHGIRLTPGRKVAETSVPAVPAGPKTSDSGFFKAATPATPRTPVRVELSPDGKMVFEGSADDVATIVKSVGNLR